jgi:hypothetical protein
VRLKARNNKARIAARSTNPWLFRLEHQNVGTGFREMQRKRAAEEASANNENVHCTSPFETRERSTCRRNRGPQGFPYALACHVARSSLVIVVVACQRYAGTRGT